jgi:hypothetical protein
MALHISERKNLNKQLQQIFGMSNIITASGFRFINSNARVKIAACLD